MQTKKLLPSLVIGISSVISVGNSSCSKFAGNYQPRIFNDIKFNELVTDTFSRKFSDTEKIIEFHKLLKKYKRNAENYIIIDKKKCKSTVYNPDGKILDVSEVALGRDIGDKRGGGYQVKGATLRAYTPPGEFEIVREGAKKTSKNFKLYEDRILILKGDRTQKKYQKSQTLALHRVPLSPMGKLRENVFNNNSIKDNRVSFGCVNYLVESFDKMKKFIKGKTTKVYILPEENGNSLHLEKVGEDEYKFFQTKYRYEYMENNK